jgi:uncharacterized protein YjbI with pentapeptide repeats
MRRSAPLPPRVSLALLALALILLVVLAWWLVSPNAGLVTAAIAAFAVLMAASVLVLPARLVARDANGAVLEGEQRANAVNSARSTLVQGLVGLAALAGIFVAWQQFQTDREQSRSDRQQLTEQLTLTRQSQVAERFTRAIEQLGSDQLEQRLGGIYGLERIAEESSSTRLQVFEVLTAYIRQNAPRSRKPVEPAIRLGGRVPDVQAVLTVLGRRTVMATDTPLDLNATDLRFADLIGARLQGAELAFAQLDGVSLTGAQLQGAVLTGAQLQRALLTDAQLQGAHLNGAQLQRAQLTDAQLQGAQLSSARLEGAELNGAQLQRAKLSGARLQRAQLANAQLQLAELYSAQLQLANLNGAQLQKAQLVDAQLQEAELRNAQLQEANLNGAQLQKAQLVDAQLEGAQATSKTVWPDGFDWKAAGVRRLG